MKSSKLVFAAFLGAAMVCLLGMSSCSKNQSENQAKGALELWDTYEAAELLPIMEAIDEMTQDLDNPLGVILSGMAYAQGPLVGQAFYNDVKTIDSIFTSDASKKLLPEDLRLAWTGYATTPRGNFYALLALKAHDGGPLFAEPVVKNATVSDSPWGLAVAIEMTEEGAEKLKALKEENADKILLWVIDGKVYPVVSPEELETADGKYLIPGIFEDEAEAEEFANFINR